MMSSFVPVLVFYVGTRNGPTWLAILLSFLSSAVILWMTRKDRLIGLLTLVNFVVLAISAGVGIVLDSEKAFLAAGPLRDFVSLPIYFGSIMLGQPLIGGYARGLNPAIAGRLPANHGVFVKLTLLWAGYDLLQGASRVWMLDALSTGEFLVWSRVVAMPFGAAIIGVTAWAIYQAAKKDAEAKGEKLPAFSWDQVPATPVLEAAD